MFYLAGVGLSLFLAVLLAAKHDKKTADKILAIWLLVITLHLFLFYCRRTGLYPQLLGFDLALPLLHGPFLYIYTRYLVDRSIPKFWICLHLGSFTIAFLYTVNFLLLPAQQKIYVFNHHGIGYETFNLINLIAIYLSGIVYVILSSVELNRHRRSIAEQFSNTEKINLDWLRYLIYWIAIIWLAVFFTNDDWIYAAVVLFVAFIGFFGIRQVGIFHTPTISHNKNIVQSVVSEPTSSEPEKRKYEKSGLNGTDANLLHQRLTELMQSEKIYRDGELVLSDLAIRLNTQPNYLSQVINEKETTNFYDYINALRIQEFKRLAALPDSRKFTLLALAQQCGFNSKSSFNRYFKKMMGQSPSEYMQSVVLQEK